MPDKKGRMTSQERKFVQLFAQSGDPQYAADKAGYTSPQQSGSQQLAKPALQEAIRREQMARLTNVLLPLATDTLERILTDPKATERGKLQATTIVYKHTVGSGIEPGEGKEPHEMSALELQERIAALRREASERATPIIEATANESQEASVFD